MGNRYGFADTEKPMNLNIWWLELIRDRIKEFILAYMTQASSPPDVSLQCYDIMFRALKMLESLAAPKFDKERLRSLLTLYLDRNATVERNGTEANLRRLDILFSKCYQRDTGGKIVRYDPRMIEEINDLLMGTYILLIVTLEEHGLLTFAPKDPSMAAGQFQNT
jgi:hypothetical protein